MKAFTRGMSGLHRRVYRASGGRVMTKMGPAPVLLLTTTGRRSATPRTTPLNYLRDGDDLVLVASFGGSATHPRWYLNFEANPDVEVQIGAERHRMRARTATPEERARLWPKVVEMYPGYGRYQEKTPREIPLVVLGLP